jgi:hypothetical protein
MSTAVLWLPAAAVAAHLFEEFVWPGGFAEWYRHYPPGYTVIVTPRFLVLMNAIFVVLALVPPVLGATERGLAFWLVVAAIAAANAVFHLVATVRGRAYSPGIVTGVALYLPLGVIGGGWLVREHLVGPSVIAQAVVVGVGYHLWSWWNHQRHARARPVNPYPQSP